MNLFIFICCIVSGVVYSENNDVVVMIHGYASDASTWDYVPEIEQSGLDVITLSVGAYDSNYDRAVDVYSQLKGVQIDYGICHSQSTGHSRFGTDYSGKALYPEWGPNNRVHFIGHSMGGLTIRYLEMFLEVGNGCSQDTSPLFQGGNDWITSITTIASPMDGTTFLGSSSVSSTDLFFSLYETHSNTNTNNLVAPQWGLVPEIGESKESFMKKIEQSGVLNEQDSSLYDLSPAGAHEFNSANKQVYSGRYYFSFAAERTSPEQDCSVFKLNCRTVQKADSDMSFSLKVTANVIGGSDNEADQVNDGIVNQVRARCPGNKNCKDIPDVTDVNWNPEQWHVVSIGYLDHYQVTGRDERNDKDNFQESAQRLYLSHGARLKQLNTFSSRNDLSSNEKLERSEKAADTLRYLRAIDFLTTPIETEEKEGISEFGVVFLTLFTVLSVIGTVVFAVVKKKKSMKKHKVKEGITSQATL